MASAPYPPSIRGRKDSLAVLDIGSSKIVCFIAEPGEDGELAITGIGHHHARGIRGGTVTDSKAAEASIAAAINMAEQMAGATIDNAMVSVSLPDLRSHLMHVELNIAGSAVSDQDIADILSEGAKSVARLEDRQIIHCFVTQYQLDGARGIRDPRNMFGMLLKADMHVVSVNKRRLMNLANTVSRCHLDISEFVASPFASAMGCLEQDERELGVTLIDLGASSTGISMFHGGANLYNAVIPVGGQHITNDLAQGLGTGITHAERLKTLHGSALPAANDDQQMIAIPSLGQEDSSEDQSVARAQVINIIRPRTEEICELVLEQLDHSGLSALAARHVVLTGGASQLVGMRELFSAQFGKPVRTGKPRLFPGLAESVSGPGFSAPVGMLFYARHRPFEDILHHRMHSRASDSFSLQRMMNWLKQRF